MNKFENVQEFDDFVMLYTENEVTAIQLPKLMEKKIFGLGFALACDFLKELGYVNYPKPDVHIMDILFAFGLCENNGDSAYKAVIEMANIVGETPYKVDKLLWLIGSGYFYMHGIKIGKNKKNLLSKTSVTQRFKLAKIK